MSRAVVVLSGALVVAMPFVSAHVGERLYVTGRHPALYAHLAAAPKNTVIATLADEGDNLPAFARRSTRDNAWRHAVAHQPLKRRPGLGIHRQFIDSPLDQPSAGLNRLFAVLKGRTDCVPGIHIDGSGNERHAGTSYDPRSDLPRRPRSCTSGRAGVP